MNLDREYVFSVYNELFIWSTLDNTSCLLLQPAYKFYKEEREEHEESKSSIFIESRDIRPLWYVKLQVTGGQYLPLPCYPHGSCTCIQPSRYFAKRHQWKLIV